MSLLSDDIRAYVDQAVLKAIAGVRTAVGTVVTSPSQVSTDPLTVVLDGGAVAVPVKGFRALPVFPGARVALVKFGSDWTVIGAYTNPAAGTGSSRIVIGADVPSELRFYGIDTAMLVYLTDHLSGLEVGYFFIGGSNRFDGGGDNRVLAFGNVVYPTPGNPASATVSNVKTNFQQQMFSPYPQTTFKDQSLDAWTDINIISPNAPGGTAKFEFTRSDGFRGTYIDDNGVHAGHPGSNSTETWQTLTLTNGWTGTCKYKLCAEARTVWLTSLGLTPGTKTDGTTIGTLPAAYRPTNNQDVAGICNSTTGQSPHFNVIASTGAINCYGFTAATGGGPNGFIALDL